MLLNILFNVFIFWVFCAQTCQLFTSSCGVEVVSREKQPCNKSEKQAPPTPTSTSTRETLSRLPNSRAQNILDLFSLLLKIYIKVNKLCYVVRSHILLMTRQMLVVVMNVGSEQYHPITLNK